MGIDRVEADSKGISVKASADVDPAIKMCQELKAAVGRKGLRKLGRVARRELEAGSAAAFSSGIDPNTGRAWKKRKHPVPWRLLYKTGGLQQSLAFDSQVYGDSKMIARTLAKDNRSGKESYHAISGALFYGRRKQSTVRSKKGKGGRMPARPFAGFTKFGINRLQAMARKQVKV